MKIDMRSPIYVHWCGFASFMINEQWKEKLRVAEQERQMTEEEELVWIEMSLFKL